MGFVYLSMIMHMEGGGVDVGITWVEWVAVVGVRVSRSVTHGRCAVHLRHLRVQLVYLKQQKRRVLLAHLLV